MARAAGTVTSADPSFLTDQFLIVRVNCMLVPAIVVDGDTVIENGFGTTPLAIAAGAMSPIISITASATATFDLRVVGRTRRIGGNLLSSFWSTTVRRLQPAGDVSRKA